MKRFIRILIEIIIDLLLGVKYLIESNARNFANIIQLALPFLMLYIGQYVAVDRGYISVGGEIFVPILVGFIIYLIRSFTNKIGKGITIPRPDKRFTEVDDDGEVNIRQDRVQELILYVADLEDWLERKGLL